MMPIASDSPVNFAPETFGPLLLLVQKYFFIPPEMLLTRRRGREISEARFALMYVLREVCDLGWSNIGRKLGNDHSAIVYGVKKAKSLRDSDPHNFGRKLRHFVAEVQTLPRQALP